MFYVNVRNEMYLSQLKDHVLLCALVITCNNTIQSCGFFYNECLMYKLLINYWNEIPTGKRKRTSGMFLSGPPCCVWLVIFGWPKSTVTPVPFVSRAAILEIQHDGEIHTGSEKVHDILIRVITIKQYEWVHNNIISNAYV